MRLLSCQKTVPQDENKCNEITCPYKIDQGYDDLRAFTVALLSHLLEIYESDLSVEESCDIDYFIRRWVSNK